MYTGQIKSAAIGSQVITVSEEAQNGHSEDEPRPPHNQEGLVAPPPSFIMAEPCSPKSVYCLANKVHPTLLLGDGGTDAHFRSD